MQPGSDYLVSGFEIEGGARLEPFTDRYGCFSSPKSSARNGIISGYVLFLLGATIAMRLFSDGDYSGIYTLGMAVQCLGFYLLYVKVNAQKSVAGISAKTLEVYVLVFVFRLSSTLTRNGYLPMDATGDWIFQLADLASLLITLHLLRLVRGTHRSTFQGTKDTMDVARLIPPCVVLAVLVHGNLNKSPFFDVMWTISMNLDTIAMLPQLWMLTKIGGEVNGMTAHFVAALSFSRACSFAFWIYGYKEVGDSSKWNFAGRQLIAAHGLQVLLSLDFMYYYLCARMKGKRMKIPMLDI
jgi:hypothetical protein